MDGLDVDTSNDIVAKKIKDFRRVITKSIDKFNSYIKLDIKKKDIEKKNIEKEDIEKKDTVKKDTGKKYLEKINTQKNSIKHDTKNNNKPDTSPDIKAHIIDKQKLIKQRYKSLLETKKTIKNNIELTYSALKKLPKE